MSDLLGSETLPGQLPELLKPWASALSGADVSTAHWLREATEVGTAWITSATKRTPEIETARQAARLASVRLADALDARGEASALKAQAQDAFRALVDALRVARPTGR